MANLRGFILMRFGKSYLLTALPLFAILSVVYIIQIALLSKKMSLTAYDLWQLYLMLAPDIIFFTIPLSFVISMSTTLMQLSQSNELIALFSFGLSPYALIKIFIIPTTLFTVLLLVISLHTMPQSSARYEEFRAQKRSALKLEIDPNRLGEKFGDYIIFVEKRVGEIYHNMVLFMTDIKSKRVIFIADRATIENDNGTIALNLHNGTADTFTKDKIESLIYTELSLFKYHHPKPYYQNSQEYWSDISTNSKKMGFFLYNIFLSLSPLASLLLIASLSIINARYQKARLYVASSTIILSIYVISSILKQSGTPLLLAISIMLFLSTGFLLFRRQVLRLF